MGGSLGALRILRAAIDGSTLTAFPEEAVGRLAAVNGWLNLHPGGRAHITRKGLRHYNRAVKAAEARLAALAGVA